MGLDCNKIGESNKKEIVCVWERDKTEMITFLCVQSGCEVWVCINQVTELEWFAPA